MTAPLAILLVGSALVIGACGLDGGPTDGVRPSGGASGQPSTGPSSPASSEEPTSEATEEAGASTEPTEEPSGSPTAEPSQAPSPGPSGSGSGGDPSACSGSVDNQDFFRAASEAMAWPVYCAILPAGWHVDSGQGGSYRLADGGRLQIAYSGPDGRRLELLEGAFCDADDGCIPGGTDLGPAAFGDRDGTLIATGDDGWAVVVDPGQPLAWQALGAGMTEDEIRAIAADLLRLAG